MCVPAPHLSWLSKKPALPTTAASPGTPWSLRFSNPTLPWSVGKEIREAPRLKCFQKPLEGLPLINTGLPFCMKSDRVCHHPGLMQDESDPVDARESSVISPASLGADPKATEQTSQDGFLTMTLTNAKTAL